MRARKAWIDKRGPCWYVRWNDPVTNKQVKKSLGQNRNDMFENRRRGIHGDAKRLWSAGKTTERRRSMRKQEAPVFRQGSITRNWWRCNR